MINKQGTRDLVETNFPYVGRVDTNPALELDKLPNNGVRRQIQVQAWSLTGNLITVMTVVVDEYRRDTRQFCTINRVTKNR